MYGLCVKDEEDDFAQRPNLCHCPESQNKAVKMLKDALQLKVSECFFKNTICILFYGTIGILSAFLEISLWILVEN